MNQYHQVWYFSAIEQFRPARQRKVLVMGLYKKCLNSLFMHTSCYHSIIICIQPITCKLSFGYGYFAF